MTLLFYTIVDLVSVFFMRLASSFGRKHEISLNKTVWSLKSSIKKYELFFFLSFLVLFIVSAFRDGVGRDYIGYANAFLRVNNGTMTSSDKNWLSYGFQLLSLVIGFLFGKNNYVMLMAVVAFITLYFFYKSIYLMSENWTLTLFILLSICVYYQSFNQLRQIMAVSITTFGLYYLMNKDLKKYVIFVGIATLVHSSAIVMLVLVFLGRWKINKKNLCIYGLATILLYIGFSFVIYLLGFTNYGRTYLGWTLYNTSNKTSSYLFLLIRLLLMCGCLFFSKETIKRKPDLVVFYNSIILCTIVQLLTIKLYLFARVSWYFYIPYIFLIPEVLKTVQLKLSKNSRIVPTLLIYILFAAYHFVYYFGGSGAVASGYDVYKFLLF